MEFSGDVDQLIDSFLRLQASDAHDDLPFRPSEKRSPKPFPLEPWAGRPGRRRVWDHAEARARKPEGTAVGAHQLRRWRHHHSRQSRRESIGDDAGPVVFGGGPGERMDRRNVW